MLNEMCVFQSELQPNERILWTGRPKQGLGLRSYDVLPVLFATIWFSVFLFIFVLGPVRSGQPFSLLFGLPFLAFGLFIGFGRLLWEALLRTRTQYAVTTNRALIQSGFLTQTLRSINLRNLTEIKLELKRDGHGTIVFGDSNPLTAMYANMAWFGKGQYTQPAFDGIENARNVYNIIQRAQVDLK